MTASSNPAFPLRSVIGIALILMGLFWWQYQAGSNDSQVGIFAAETDSLEGNSQQIFRLEGYTMGTTYSLQSVGLPQSLSRDEFAVNIDSQLQRLDKEIFSTYQENSELSRLNQSEIGEALRVSSELIDVLQLSKEISELSGGAFDATIGPLVNLWGFGPENRPEHGNTPAQNLITERLAQVNYRQISIDEEASTATRLANVYIDLSAIAKGYVVDQLALYFDSQKIDNYFLEVGGELKMKGQKPKESELGVLEWASWVPAIERPVDAAPSVYEVLYSRGEQIAVAGSGDYRNYFEVDGIRYSHEIDPRSGFPITHTLAAAYVIHESAALADALATTYMILGLEEGSVLAAKENHAVFFIARNAEDNDSGALSGFDETVTAPFSVYLNE